MFLAVLVVGAVTLNDVLSVETGSPDALCPALKQTTEAVHARLGTLKSEQPGWRARYTVGHAPGSGEGDFIHLELFDPNQRLQLARELPVGQASCATLAQSIAIVLSGYFESLAPLDGESSSLVSGSGSDTPSGRPSPQLQPELPSAGADAGAPKQANFPPKRAPEPGAKSGKTPRSSETQRSLGAGFAIPFALYGRGVTVSYAASPSSHTQYGALLVLPLERTSSSVDVGSVFMWSARARFWYGFQAVVGRLVSVVGPSVSLGLDSASTRGLDEPRRQQRMVVALGLLLDATFWMNGSLGLGLQAGMDVGEKLGSRRFIVQGSGTGSEEEVEVHPSRWVNGFAGTALKVHLPN